MKKVRIIQSGKNISCIFTKEKNGLHFKSFFKNPSKGFNLNSSSKDCVSATQILLTLSFRMYRIQTQHLHSW